MCTGTVMVVISKDGHNAIAEKNGVRVGISLRLVPDAKIGERVLVHAGYAIAKCQEDIEEDVVCL